MSDTRQPPHDAELAYRVAEYVRGALVASATATEIETETRRAWFMVEGSDGQSVRVTVDDVSRELA